MKLDWFASYSHACEQFGKSSHEFRELHAWRPSRIDRGIELILFNNGLFAFMINGNIGCAFRADFKKLTRERCADLGWSSSFSWIAADDFARRFGEAAEREMPE